MDCCDKSPFMSEQEKGRKIFHQSEWKFVTIWNESSRSICWRWLQVTWGYWIRSSPLKMLVNPVKLVVNGLAVTPINDGRRASLPLAFSVLCLRGHVSRASRRHASRIDRPVDSHCGGRRRRRSHSANWRISHRALGQAWNDLFHTVDALGGILCGAILTILLPLNCWT